MSGAATPVIPQPDKKQAMRDSYFALMGIGPLTRDQMARITERVDLVNKGVLSSDQLKRVTKLDKLIAKDIAAEEKRLETLGRQGAAAEKHKAIYLDRLNRSEATLSELRDYAPASDALVAEFTAAHTAAAQLAAVGSWQDAFKALKSVHVSSAPEKAAAAFDKSREKARKQHPEAFAIVDEIKALLANDRNPLTERVRGVISAELLEQARPLLKADATAPEIAEVVKRLGIMREDLSADLDRVDTLQREVRLLRGDAMVAMDLLAKASAKGVPVITDRQEAVLRRQVASADTAVAAHDFETARDLLQTVASEAKDQLVRSAGLAAEWLTLSAQLQPNLDAAMDLADSASSPSVGEGALSLAEALEEIETLGPGRGISLRDAIDRVKNAAAHLRTLQAEEDEFLAFRGARLQPPSDDGYDADEEPDDPAVAAPARADRSGGLKGAIARVEKRIGEIESLISTLHKRVAALTDGQARTVADGPFRTRLDQAKQEWQASAASAHDAASLNERGTMAALDLIWSDIDSILDDETRLSGAIDAGKLQRAQAKYAEARKPAMAAAERLLALDAVSGAGFIAGIEELDAATATAGTAVAYRKAVAKLGKLVTQLDGKSARRDAAYPAEQEKLTLALAPIPAKLAELKGLVDKASTGAKQTALANLLETLTTTYDSLRATAKLTQIDQLKAAVTEAEEFAEEVDASIQAARGKPDDAAGTMSFEQARKAIANFKVALDKPDIKAYATVTAFDISERVTALETGLGSTTMSELATKVNAIGASIAAMKIQAQDAKALAAAFTKDLKSIEDKLKASVFAPAPAYKESVQAQLAALASDARFEGGLKDAKAKALALSTELDALVAGPKDVSGRPVALAEKQRAASEAAIKKEADKNTFLGLVDVLERELTRQKSVNPDEVAPLLDTLAATKKAIDKSKDYESGQDQLVSIRKRMSLVAANPNGLAITARNKLPQVLQRVTRAITGLSRGTFALEKAVLAVPPDELDDAAKTAVSRQLAAVRGLFNPSVFTAPVAKITAGGNPASVRAAEREKALRELRQMQAYVEKDFRLATLASTPFVPGIDSAVSEVALALLDLENNLLVSA